MITVRSLREALSRRATGDAGARMFPDLPAPLDAVLRWSSSGMPAHVPTLQGLECSYEEAMVGIRSRLCGAMLRATSNGLAVPAEAHALMKVVHMADSALCLALQNAAFDVSAALSRAGVEHVFTKGIATSRFYPDPSVRAFCDVDVLVGEKMYAPAARVLEDLGFLPPAGVPRPRVLPFTRESINFLRPDGLSVDLHHAVPPWYWGKRIRFEDVRAAADRLDADGRAIPVVAEAHAFLIALLQLISDQGGPAGEIQSWRDLLVLLARDPEGDILVPVLRDADLSWLAVQLLGNLPSDLRPAWLGTLGTGVRPRATEAFRLRRLLPPSVAARHQVSTIYRASAPRAAVFLFAQAVPSRRFLRARYDGDATYRRWWKDALTKLRTVGDRVDDELPLPRPVRRSDCSD